MIGQTISHYKIIEKIGSGGMGVVYKARDTKLDRFIALKFLSQNLTSDEEATQRFKREGKSAAVLNHPNIVTIYEIGEHDGQLFITMEYVDGRTLREEIDEQQLGNSEIRSIAIQLCEGLTKAHEAGIVHRDIKPENILIDNDGRVKILDFGLAKLKGTDNLTKDTSTLGTIKYMSPEQIRGEKVDHRTDIWSLGVILYELLSGEAPFKGEYDQAVIYSILNEDPPEIKGLKDNISAEIYDLIRKMLVKEVDERLQSCEEVITEFDEIGARSRSGSSQIAATGISQLWGKKMLQTVLLYVLASVALTSIIGWLSDQILLSPYLTDFILIVSLSMLPTALILTWQSKKSKAGKWLRNTGISLNLLIVIGILGFLFYDKDLGYTHESVTFTDDEGNVVNKVIPKDQFRKTVAIFPIENVSRDSSYNWLQNGIVYLLWFDLMQDLYVKSDVGYNQNNKPQIESDGFPDGIKMPLSYQRKISESLYKDFFLTGYFDLKDSTYLIDMTLFKAENMKKISNRRVSGSEIFILIDELSVDLRRDLGIPEKHIEQNEDWPITEIIGSSMEAVELIMKGLNIFFYEYDHKKALPYYKKGLQIDSTIALAYVHLAMIYDMLGEYELRDAAADKMMKNIYRMPTSMQLYAKNNYYEYKGDRKHQVKVAEMHVHLYPEDYQAREHLADLYIGDGKIDMAVEQYRHLMGGYSEEGEILNRIGRMFLRSGEYEKALDFYLQYIGKSPDDYRAYEGLASTYWEIGELDEAILQYEKALLIEPNNLILKLDRLWLDYDLGNHDRLENELTGLLKQSDSHDSRCQVYEDLERLYSQLGQIKKIIDFWPKYLSEYEESSDYAEFIYFLHNMQLGHKYALIGDNQSAMSVFNKCDINNLKGFELHIYASVQSTL